MKFAWIVAAALTMSSCARSEEAVISEPGVSLGTDALVTTFGACRFTKPTTLGLPGLDALLQGEFGTQYGFGDDALMKPAGGTFMTSDRGGTFALWLGNAGNPKSGVGWSDEEQTRLRRLLRDSGWTSCTLQRGAFAERAIDGEWINVQFVIAGGANVALLFSNYGDEPLPPFGALDAGD